MQFKALLIDLDGVIWQWPVSNDLIEARCGLPDGSIRQAAFSADLLSPAITGQISDEEWRGMIAARLQLAYSSKTAVDAVQAWTLVEGSVDWETVSILRQCDPSIQRVLVTNATSRLERDLSQLKIAQEFDLIVNSSTVGVAKPDPRIFEIALLLASAMSKEALFIDDVPENVSASQKLGMTGHVFCDHGELRRFLRRQGVMLPEGGEQAIYNKI